MKEITEVITCIQKDEARLAEIDFTLKKRKREVKEELRKVQIALKDISNRVSKLEQSPPAPSRLQISPSLPPPVAPAPAADALFAAFKAGMNALISFQ